jgi:dihydrolipoamide dehydrogenase
MYDVIVIGGGPAGVTAALRSSELGAKVALLEKYRLGGTCTNDGCAPTRVLAKAARLVRDYEQFDEYGLFASRPELDFEALMSSVQQKIYRLHEKKQLLNHLAVSGVKVRTDVGEVKFVNENTVRLENGEELTAEKFIISAGGHARQISFPGSEYALNHSDMWSLKKLPRSMVIVGGAATGCQVASIFAAFGVEVYLLEVNPKLLGREDPMIGEAITQSFKERGIHVITGIGGVDHIEKLNGTESGLAFYYKQDDEVRRIDAEAVMVSVGWIGNIESLNLEAVGVQTNRGYIQVNDFMQSTTPHIFAAGDITGKMMLVQSGTYEGRIAAENAVLGTGLPYQHKIVPHGGFTDPEYGSVGLTEPDARKVEPDCIVAVVPYADMDRAVIDERTEGYCKLIVSQETHRILGAHLVGEQALEVTQMVAAGMSADMWVEHLAELEIAYPTFAAVVGLAARHVVRDLGVMPLSPQWRTLGRRHAAEWERSSFH